MENKPWIVWSNEHGAFWGMDHCGYVSDVRYAGRYTTEEAKKICDWQGEPRNPPNEVTLVAPECAGLQLTEEGTLFKPIRF